MNIDPKLKDWATTRQGEIIDALITAQTYGGAARALKVDESYVRKALAAVQKRAAMRGYAPESDMRVVVPDPFVVRGTSTLYGDDGALKMQWVKTRLDDQRAELALRAAVEALAEDVPRAAVVKPPKQAQQHLLNLYTLTDCHVGMRAWAPETGADWDLSIAERTLAGAFHHLIDSTPAAGTAVVAQLGDWLHYDGMSPVTPLHGNVLDADGRYEKVVQVAVRILRTVIDAALRKHLKVIVVMAEGNHDMASSVWLRHLFALLYENQPRLHVIDSPLPYYAHQHGLTMLGFHHGHLAKNGQLPLLMASQFPEMWGTSRRRYCHVGHKHHVEEKEHSGMIVVQHPTIAARGGWIADRTMTAITYHAEHGQVGRTTVVPEMLEGG
jgi:hypothetical protein